jgi:hypothetical protein
MLKKLLHPKVEDICPNCGEACAIVEVLCPNCGENLDELFEQLPDSEVTCNAHLITGTLMIPQLIKGWNSINIVVLIASLLAPWAVFYSDIFFGKPQPQYVIGFKVLLFPVLELMHQQEFSPGRFLPNLGLSLLEAIAPAIAIYYSLHGLGAVFKIGTRESAPKYYLPILRLLLTALSLALFDFGTGFNSDVSWGYFLVIAGLSSSVFLELISPSLGRPMQA